MERPGVPAWFAVDVSDPEHFVEGLRGATLQATQLSRGSLGSELARIELPQGHLDLVRLGPAMLFSGAVAGDAYTITFVLDCPEPGEAFNFQTQHSDGYIGVFAPGGALDAMTPAGYASITLTVPASGMFETFLGIGEALTEEVLDRGAGFRISDPAQRPIRDVADAAWRMVRDPARPLDTATVREGLGRAAVSAFRAAICDGGHLRLPPPSVRLARRYGRLRQARDFVASHIAAPIYVDDLCQATGLTPRGLEFLFQDLLGVNPVRFLLHKRLHGARDALLAAPPTPGVIKRVALEWGFWHLGRFAGSYRALFGESPSATLVRGVGRSPTRSLPECVRKLN
jgi:AraC-like DNA-binding protein